MKKVMKKYVSYIMAGAMIFGTFMGNEITTNAMISVQEAVDTDALEEAMMLNSDYNRNDYTAESWGAFDEAIMNAAALVYGDDPFTQNDVDTALTAILTAKENLSYVPYTGTVSDATHFVAKVVDKNGNAKKNITFVATSDNEYFDQKEVASNENGYVVISVPGKEFGVTYTVTLKENEDWKTDDSHVYHADMDEDYWGCIDTIDGQSVSEVGELTYTIQLKSTELTYNDFVIEGTTIKGITEIGLEKVKETGVLTLPDKNEAGEWITEIAAAAAGKTGLFATAEGQFKKVVLPSHVETIGNFAFQNTGMEEVSFPNTVKSIGQAAFQNNALKEVVLPDSVTALGAGSFASNYDIEKIVISKGLTDIPATAFGCATTKGDKRGMVKLTSLEIPTGIKTIGNTAFAGNNLTNIVIPEGVTSIGTSTFSTDADAAFQGVTTVSLPKTLTSIGNKAFNNQNIAEITLPVAVTKLPNAVFANTAGRVVKVHVADHAQYANTKNFPTSTSHVLERAAHASKEVKTVPATCVADGVAAHFICENEGCELYGLLFSDKDLTEEVTAESLVLQKDPDAHTFKDVVIPATYEKEGLATPTCSGCGLVDEKNIRTLPVLTVKGTTISKLKSMKKGFQVTVKKQTTATTGYQIQYARKKSFAKAKSAVIKSNKTVSKQIKKLKRHKKYYVRVRTYYKVNGKTYYSAWSKAKTVKTK